MFHALLYNFGEVSLLSASECRESENNIVFSYLTLTTYYTTQLVHIFVVCGTNIGLMTAYKTIILQANHNINPHIHDSDYNPYICNCDINPHMCNRLYQHLPDRPALFYILCQQIPVILYSNGWHLEMSCLLAYYRKAGTKLW